MDDIRDTQICEVLNAFLNAHRTLASLAVCPPPPHKSVTGNAYSYNLVSMSSRIHVQSLIHLLLTYKCVCVVAFRERVLEL